MVILYVTFLYLYTETKMILGRVKNGIAVWRCSECGAEQPIIQYMLVPNYGTYIHMDDVLERRDAFIALHTLCKKLSTQSPQAKLW